MTEYKRCSEASIGSAYEAFKKGFSDYIVKTEISASFFEEHFFGPEGNSPEFSHIAFENGEPVGLMLGGIRNYEGVKTMRCGAACVVPELRGKGVARELFIRHKETAMSHGCRQLFLEVISGNERAERFYEKVGYERVYDLSYYGLKATEGLKIPVKTDGYRIVEGSVDDIKNIAKRSPDVHVNWQNSIFYIENLPDQMHYVMYAGSGIIGGLSLSKTGRVSFLWTDPAYRMQGNAKRLLAHAAGENEFSEISVSFPNNALLKGFAEKTGFVKKEIEQHEMYFFI